MKRDVAAAGLIGLAGGGLVFIAACWLNANVPLLIQSTLGITIVFFVVLALALFEMPVMVWGLRKMARDASTPRLALLGTHVAYCSFAAVYAAAFVLVTRQQTLAMLLAALALLRFASGAWIR